jgi:hypothetical protein
MLQNSLHFWHIQAILTCTFAAGSILQTFQVNAHFLEQRIELGSSVLHFDRGSLAFGGRSGRVCCGRSSARFNGSNGAGLNLLHVHCTRVSSASNDRKAALNTPASKESKSIASYLLRM